MSKKQKRQVSQSVNTGTASRSAAPARTATPAAASFSRRMVGQTEFKPDYSHVISDLKRIGILAGSFFVILIVLSFFLK
jgi:hypothetical protein